MGCAFLFLFGAAVLLFSFLTSGIDLAAKCGVNRCCSSLFPEALYFTSRTRARLCVCWVQDVDRASLSLSVSFFVPEVDDVSIVLYHPIYFYIPTHIPEISRMLLPRALLDQVRLFRSLPE